MAVTDQDNNSSLSDDMMADSGLPLQDLPENQGDAPATAPPPTKQNAPTEKKDPPAGDPPATDPPATDPPKPAADAKPPATDTSAPADPPAGDPDIDDEKLLAALRKKTGRDYKSLDELKTDQPAPTAEEKLATEEKERSAAIEFGKQNNLFTQAQYDSFITFSAKEKIDVVQEAFTQKLLKDDPDMTQDEAADLFKEMYNIYEDEDSVKYKHSQALIAQEYEQIKRGQYANIVDVKETYLEVQKNIQRANVFKSQVDEIFTKLPTKFEFTIDKELVSYPIDLNDKKIAGIVSTIKQDYLTIAMMNSTVDQTGKVDQAALLGEITKDLQIAVLQQMVTEVAKSYSDIRLTKNKMGRKGAIELDTETAGARGSNEPGLSDRLMKEAGFEVPAGANGTK